MAIPTLKLNLAPPSNFWRLNHGLLGWSALGLGGLLLAGSLSLTWVAYRQAAKAGAAAGNLSVKARGAAAEQSRVVAELRAVDVPRELPRWRLAERIYSERSLPWSRLTAELERSLVKDVRLKSLQRNRGSDMKVQLKLKGEARSREAEAKFVESLQKNSFFDQVILEREAERQGGGVEFDYTLAASSTPPAFKPLPKVAAAPAAAAAKGAAARPGAPVNPAPARPGVAVPAPVRPVAPAQAPAQPPPRPPAAAGPEPDASLAPPMGGSALSPNPRPRMIRRRIGVPSEGDEQ